MDQSQLDELQQSMEALLPELKLEGLEVRKVSFDFYSESADVVFGYDGKQVRVRLPMERVRELQEGRAFAAKRLRDQLYKSFGVQDE